MLLRQRMPSKAGYRMFSAYALLVLVPFAFILIHFHQAEALMREKTVEQNRAEVGELKRSLLDLMGLMSRSQALLARNPVLENVLHRDSAPISPAERSGVERSIGGLNNSLVPSSPPIYVTVIDAYGEMFSNYRPKEAVDGKRLYTQLLTRYEENPDMLSFWEEESSWLSNEIVGRETFLTLNSVLRTSDLQPYAVIKISVDYRAWFAQRTAEAAGRAEYFIVDGKRNRIARSTPQSRPEAGGRPQPTIPLKPVPVPEASMKDNTLYIYDYVKPLDWYVLKKVPLNYVFLETDLLKKSLLTIFFVFTLMVVAVMFTLSRASDRPFHTMKVKKGADEAQRPRLAGTAGEKPELAASFNPLVRRIQRLIHLLKAEERQKESVRFQVLVSQMNPHFLLNTLNVIKSQALKNGDQTTFTICTALGTLLENSLKVESDLVHLKDELGFVEAYMAIQNIRFSGRYQVHYEYEGDLLYALVPKFTLQPLVENAIIHAYADSVGREPIVIRAFANGRSLHLTVEDRGKGFAGTASARSSLKRPGIGLNNIRERLALLYKGAGELRIHRLEAGTRVEIVIPLLLSKPYPRGDEPYV